MCKRTRFVVRCVRTCCQRGLVRACRRKNSSDHPCARAVVRTRARKCDEARAHADISETPGRLCNCFDHRVSRQQI
eukprot:8131615-Pyramimonas_sp.AAC.1